MKREYFTESMTYAKPEPRHSLCGQWGSVTLQQRGKDNFAVRYGKQVDADLSYSQACAELGQAIMHELACDGRLDNRGKNER